MDIGIIVGLVLGSIIMLGGCVGVINRDSSQREIKKWENDPRTIAKITGTINKRNKDGDYIGYCYRADIFIDGTWCKAQCWDTFHGEKTCKIDDEIEVAYRPIRKSKKRIMVKMSELANKIMSVMVDVFFNENWEEQKPRYYFKFIDPSKYENEKNVGVGSSVFFIVFGLVMILLSIAAHFGLV